MGLSVECTYGRVYLGLSQQIQPTSNVFFILRGFWNWMWSRMAYSWAVCGRVAGVTSSEFFCDSRKREMVHSRWHFCKWPQWVALKNEWEELGWGKSWGRGTRARRKIWGRPGNILELQHWLLSPGALSWLTVTVLWSQGGGKGVLEERFVLWVLHFTSAPLSVPNTHRERDTKTVIWHCSVSLLGFSRDESDSVLRQEGDQCA